MQMGGGSPEASVSALRVQIASLAKSEECLVSASFHGNVNFSTAATKMRRLPGSYRGAVRQDVLVAADVDMSSEEGSDHAAWLAYRRAQKKKGRARREDGDAAKG